MAGGEAELVDHGTVGPLRVDKNVDPGLSRRINGELWRITENYERKEDVIPSFRHPTIKPITKKKKT